MTRRELALAFVVLVVVAGLMVASVFLLRSLRIGHQTVAVVVPADTPTDVAPLDAGTDAHVVLHPLPPFAEEPGVVDSGPPTRDAAGDALPVVVRAANLLVHPAGKDNECMDSPSHGGHGLQLFRCHGRTNQRWTFAEDTGGASRIYGGEGGCVRIGAREYSGEPPLVVGACDSGVPRFRHREDKRLEEVASGQCVTARAHEKRVKLFLEPCDASNAGQTFTFSP